MKIKKLITFIIFFLIYNYSFAQIELCDHCYIGPFINEVRKSDKITKQLSKDVREILSGYKQCFIVQRETLQSLNKQREDEEAVFLPSDSVNIRRILLDTAYKAQRVIFGTITEDTINDKISLSLSFENLRTTELRAGTEVFSYEDYENHKIRKRILETFIINSFLSERKDIGSGKFDTILIKPKKIDSLVLIPKNSFIIGNNKGPSTQHGERNVEIDSFYISPYEVTFEEYEKYYHNKPNDVAAPNDEGFERPKDRPVIHVSWLDAINYCNWLTDQHPGKLKRAYKVSSTGSVERVLNANGYRLPTEAEWEYVATFDKNGDKFLYSGSTEPFAVAITRENSKLQTGLVRSKKPNGFGLYDMSGNVWEWVEDYWNENYETLKTDGSARWSGDSNYRVVRGGSWLESAKYATTKYRTKRKWNEGRRDCGFRIVRSK